VAGELKRLMIFAPPQHGKSELASVRLPAFWMGRRPDDPVILTSYAASLAESKSRQARSAVESDEFATLFPKVRTRQDSRAVDHWELSGHRGGMLAVGVGGPITGHGTFLGIIDDPFENWKQAQSLTIRNAVWEWYRTTFRTRIWEGGAIVLIMTRWHEDDLAGRILSEQAADWTVLRLPATAETQEERDSNNARMGLPFGEPDLLGRQPGEPLCPRRYSSAALADLRRDVGSLGWQAEYQGTPRAPEGNRFKRAWFGLVNAIPAGCSLVRYWDKAGTQDGGARTAGVLMARSPDGAYYVVDAIVGQWGALERERTIRQTAELDARQYANRVHVWLEQEPGSGGKESAEATIRNLSGFPAHKETVTGDKDTRLEPFAAQAEAENVMLVRGAWNSTYLDELTAIPNGQYRDQSDASSGAFNKLAGSTQGSRTRRTA
jgi:predicted phage terminase large subunit-like protein